MQIQTYHQQNVMFGEQVTENDVTRPTFPAATMGHTHIPPVNFHEVNMGPQSSHLNAFIPQSDGAGDAFWDDLMHTTEDSFMENMDDLSDISDINAEGSYQSLPIDYSSQNPLWPSDQDLPMMDLDLN